MTQQSLGSKIKSERQKKGLSLRKLAEKLEITAAYLVDIEKDRRMPSSDVIQRIADLLDLPVSDLQQFGAEIPKIVKEWLDTKPLVSKILSLMGKSTAPEKTVSDFEAFVTNPQHRQPLFAIYESELQAIGQESISWNSETGGDLFGIWGDVPLIYLATKSGPNAIRSQAHFRLDVEYLVKLSIDLDNDWGLRYFGDWHSHHRLGLQSPSSGDQRRIHQIAKKNHFLEMAEVIVTFSSNFDFDKKVQINPYVYGEAASDAPSEAGLIILKGLSPVREALMDSNSFLEQRLSLYSSFSIDQITTLREPLGRLQSLEGLPIDQVSERVFRRAVLELEKLSADKIEEHKTKFGHVLVASTIGQKSIGIAVDEKWPYQILQVNSIDRKSGKTEELALGLSKASFIKISELKQIFQTASELIKSQL